jgi:sortase (surface protein transpeptidase)
MNIKRNTKPVKKIIYSVSILLIVAGLVGIYLYFTDRQNAMRPITIIPTKTVVLSLHKPSEAPVSSNNFVKVPADQPQEIIIPSINVDGYIQKVGVDQNNQMAVPNNIYLAGWYVNSVKPGEPGLSIIDGHVLGRYNDAIFKDLINLKLGSTFSIIYGDSSEKSFVVKEIKLLPVNDTAVYLNKKDPNIKSQLNLITCGGNFDRNSQTYDKRVVVKSEGI